MLKYLRIAVTALSLTACVLLIALWVRSYWYWESLNWYFSTTKYINVSSDAGQLSLGVGDLPGVMPGYWRGKPGVYVGGQFVMPHLLLLLGTAVLSALPWLPWRFSLRTLLIATTLVAVVLGIIVAAR